MAVITFLNLSSCKVIYPEALAAYKYDSRGFLGLCILDYQAFEIVCVNHLKVCNCSLYNLHSSCAREWCWSSPQWGSCHSTTGAQQTDLRS